MGSQFIEESDPLPGHAEEFAGHRLIRHPVPSQQHLQACAAPGRAQRSRDEAPIAPVLHGDADLVAAACRGDGIEECSLDGALGEESRIDRPDAATGHRRADG